MYLRTLIEEIRDILEVKWSRRPVMTRGKGKQGTKDTPGVRPGPSARGSAPKIWYAKDHMQMARDKKERGGDPKPDVKKAKELMKGWVRWKGKLKQRKWASQSKPKPPKKTRFIKPKGQSANSYAYKSPEDKKNEAQWKANKEARKAAKKS